MSADALLAWKAKIAIYQQQVKASLPAKQDTLFDLAGLGISPAHVDPDTIDPFSLLLQPMSCVEMACRQPRGLLHLHCSRHSGAAYH
jgi:hypothetical protein